MSRFLRLTPACIDSHGHLNKHLTESTKTIRQDNTLARQAPEGQALRTVQDLMEDWLSFD
jgi:hypothetical protein